MKNNKYQNHLRKLFTTNNFPHISHIYYVICFFLVALSYSGFFCWYNQIVKWKRTNERKCILSFRFFCCCWMAKVNMAKTSWWPYHAPFSTSLLVIFANIQNRFRETANYFGFSTKSLHCVCYTVCRASTAILLLIMKPKTPKFVVFLYD